MSTAQEQRPAPGYESLPVLDAPRVARFALEGTIGRLLHTLIEQWVLPAPFSNPEMLEMFRDPDRRPLRDRVQWAGEFAGKYLTHATQLHRLAPSRRLRDQIKWFVKELIALQQEDGYLGPWPNDCHLANMAPNSAGSTKSTWDTWGHYHIMLGLILWYRESRDRQALTCARRIADLLRRKFLGTGVAMSKPEWAETNQAPIHALALLYRETGEPSYLKLAQQVATEFEIPGAGDYLRQALAGKEFFATPKPRWESLHPIQGLAELHLLTGDANCRQAFEALWWSMVKTDRHNNGGFTSGEKAQGSPYHEGPIETCCTVAWSAMSIDMLRLTGNSVVADELELSLFNSGIGFTSPSGRWVTYNTPMDGTKIASPNDATAFQARPAGAELNCCSVNGPRIFGMVSDWAIMTQTGGLALNYYGAGTITTPLPSGNAVTIVQSTDYPWENRVTLTINPTQAEKFPLLLRIPHWSKETAVEVNGTRVAGVPPGGYLALDRTWKPGDAISIAFDFRLRFWTHEADLAAGRIPPRASIYRGPILLAYDPRFNADGEMPALRADGLAGRRVEPDTWLKPCLLLQVPAADGRSMRLCDFGSAGNAGHAYRSWLPVHFGATPPKCIFSRKNPLRTMRA